ncbi:hypothetical protein BDR07DRAFT_1411813 [Suillus spraguei]|nr:hypothetical protein BDR07DRAFT_1411813 [Suillus spraguei]
MLRHGLLSPHSKLLPSSHTTQNRLSVASDLSQASLHSNFSDASLLTNSSTGSKHPKDSRDTQLVWDGVIGEPSSCFTVAVLVSRHRLSLGPIPRAFIPLHVRFLVLCRFRCARDGVLHLDTASSKISGINTYL